MGDVSSAMIDVAGGPGTLAVDTSGTNITANLSGDSKLQGVDTVANYEKVLRTTTYENAMPGPAIRVAFSVFDSAGRQNPSSKA